MSTQRDDGGGRIAALEHQLNELRALLAEERSKHREEQRAAATKLRLLESSTKGGAAEAAAGSTSTTTVRTVTIRKATATPRSGPATPREMVVSTPRTSNNLFVAVKSTSSATAAARGTRVISGSTTTTTTRTRSGVAKGATTPRDASPATTAVVPLAASRGLHQPTALQHAWDKFCVIARESFTPEQLALVSAETLDKLLDQYKISNPVERAQIEAQWALLQEGKDSVGASATPRVVPRNSRSPIRQAQHTKEFDLRPDTLKPKLSRKQLLCAEAPKPSNPNSSTSASALIRSNSMQIIRPRGVGVGNPNDTESRSNTPRLCFRRCDTSHSARETPRGMMHVDGPSSKEHRDRGIRSEGSTFEGPDRPKIESLRTGYGGPNDDGKHRGVRTFDKEPSPTRHHRPSKIVSTPPHIQRWHLGTATLGVNGRRPTTPGLSPRQSWTPFAVDN